MKANHLSFFLQANIGRVIKKLPWFVPKLIFWIGVIWCVSTFLSPVVALALGFIVAQTSGHPYAQLNHRATQYLLQTSVVGLGFGMNVSEALQTGQVGIGWTVLSIATTLTMGILLGRWLKMDQLTAHLIAAGTAICGGSAIATLAPVLKAPEKQVSVALGTIFLLNAFALIVFPWLGQQLHLSAADFGLWCALAIHDTSSVVGAAAKFGPEALQVATTVKLTRALWIMPVAIVSSLWFQTGSTQVRLPYFIVWFIGAMVLNTYLPGLRPFWGKLVLLAHQGLNLTLFLIGASLSRQMLKGVGWQPFLQGFGLWVFISLLSLLLIEWL